MKRVVAVAVLSLLGAIGTAHADGQTVYRGLCFSCHDTGAAGAPKLGDRAAWAPRVATGKASLYQSALNGKGAMPAKGGNPGLSDDQIKSAVDFIVSKTR